MTERCRLELAGKFKNFSAKQLEEIAEDVEKIIGEANLRGENVSEIIKQMSKEFRRKVQMQEAQRLLAIEKFNKAKEFINQEGFKGNKAKALGALLSTDHSAKYTGDNNLWRLKDSIKNEYLGALTEATNAPGVWKRFASGEMDADIKRYLIDGATDMDEATMNVAKAIKKANNRTFFRKRAAGVDVNYLSDFVTKQRHNPEKMIEIGKNKWKAEIAPLLDRERMKITSDAHFDDVLEEMYGSIVEKHKNRWTPMRASSDFEEIATNRVSNSMGASRSIHFKDGLSAHRYDELMETRRLSERLFQDAEAESGKIAAMELLGPNYRQVWNELKREFVEDLSANDIRKLDRHFDFAIRGQAIPGDSLLAKTGDTLRKISNITKLSTALPTTLTDFGFGAGIISGITGKNYLGAMGDLMSDFMKSVSPTNRKAVAQRLNIFLDDVNMMNISSRYGDHATLAGRVTSGFDRFHNGVMRLTGLPAQAAAMRVAIAKHLSVDLFEDIGKRFDDLYPGKKELLTKFGFTADDWGKIKNGFDEFSDGSKGITPEAIFDLPDEIFGKNKAKANAEKSRIASALSSYLTEGAEKGSPTPGLKQQAWKGAVDPNTVAGQAVRFMGQFKSFALSQFDTMSAIKNVGTQSKYGNVSNVAATIVAATGMGYLALAAKDILNGREIRDPNDPKTWVDAFVQSGAGLIYTDFLAAEYQKSYRSLAADLAGPAISGTGNDVAEVFATLMRTDLSDDDSRRKTAKKILDKMERNTPSIFMGKQILWNHVYDGLHKALNTGKKRKQGIYNVLDFN